MPILVTYRIQCGGCQRFVPGQTGRKPATTTELFSGAFTSQLDGITQALHKGWSSYPLLCPDCANEFKERLRDEQQDRGDVRPTG